MTPEEAIVVLVTVGSAADGERIGRTLVGEGLAACVNVVGAVRSIYRWQGALEEAEEHLLIIKARAADVAALEARVKALHAYETPEFLALPVLAGSRDYLAWLGDVTARGR